MVNIIKSTIEPLDTSKMIRVERAESHLTYFIDPKPIIDEILLNQQQAQIDELVQQFLLEKENEKDSENADNEEEKNEDEV